MLATRICEFLQKHSCIMRVLGKDDARFVGGCVRDLLLGYDGHDVDIATIHNPYVSKNLLTQAGYHVHDVGVSFGTVVAVEPHTHRVYEVTTLRHDHNTDGRHAHVRYHSNWCEDAFRRDLTINGLFLDAYGVVHDHVHGQKDLEQHRLRFIGDANGRVQEDFLRILRMMRFFARFGWSIERESRDACMRYAPYLRRLSKERITSEMVRLLKEPYALKALKLMQGLGIEKILWAHPHHESFFLTYCDVIKNFHFPWCDFQAATCLWGREPLDAWSLSRKQKRIIEWTNRGLYHHACLSSLMVQTPYAYHDDALIGMLVAADENQHLCLIKRISQMKKAWNHTPITSEFIINQGYKGKDIGEQKRQQTLRYLQKIEEALL